MENQKDLAAHDRRAGHPAGHQTGRVHRGPHWPRPNQGPLIEPAAVEKVTTEQEAVDAANATEFGLASYFYRRDVGRIFRVAEALEYGMVGIDASVIATGHVPSRRRQAIRPGPRGIVAPRHRRVRRDRVPLPEGFRKIKIPPPPIPCSSLK